MAPQIAAKANLNDVMNRLTHLITSPDSARFIGSEYLQSLPSSARNSSTMVHALCAISSSNPDDWIKLGDQDLRNLIDRQQRKDFEYNRTVKIDGWILSETEVRLCALATLAPHNISRANPLRLA
jgi:hypothetical protein